MKEKEIQKIQQTTTENHSMKKMDLTMMRIKTETRISVNIDLQILQRT